MDTASLARARAMSAEELSEELHHVIDEMERPDANARIAVLAEAAYRLRTLRRLTDGR